jgi:hypothetical protein
MEDSNAGYAVFSAIFAGELTTKFSHHEGGSQPTDKNGSEFTTKTAVLHRGLSRNRCYKSLHY